MLLLRALGLGEGSRPGVLGAPATRGAFGAGRGDAAEAAASPELRLARGERHSSSSGQVQHLRDGSAGVGGEAARDARGVAQRRLGEVARAGHGLPSALASPRAGGEQQLPVSGAQRKPRGEQQLVLLLAEPVARRRGPRSSGVAGWTSPRGSSCRAPSIVGVAQRARVVGDAVLDEDVAALRSPSSWRSAWLHRCAHESLSCWSLRLLSCSWTPCSTAATSWLIRFAFACSSVATLCLVRAYSSLQSVTSSCATFRLASSS